MVALGSVSASALCAQAALAQAAPSQALPPPPYASMQAPAYAPAPGRAQAYDARTVSQPLYRGVQAYGGPQGYDRYGGGGSHPRVGVASPMAPTPVAYQGPRLGWSGKAETAPAQPQVQARSAYLQPGQAEAAYVPPAPASRARAAQPYPGAAAPVRAPYAAYRGMQAGGQTGTQLAQQPAPRGWTYMAPAAQQPVPQQPAAQPTSIYDPAPPPAAPATPAPPVQVASAAGGQETVHHYSLHREFGMAPDPIPLAPQFFGATADLSQPETPEPMRRTVTADGKSHNALQPTDGQ